MKQHVSDSVKYFARLSAIAAFTFLKVNLLSAASTFMVASVGFYFLSRGINAGHSGHVSTAPTVMLMFFSRPLGTALLFLIVAASPFLFFIFGNKYVLQKIAQRVLSDHAESTIYPALDKISRRISQQQPDLLRKGSDYSILKLRMLSQARSETDSKWTRRLIAFGIGRMKLDDVDFGKENLRFSEIVRDKAISALKEAATPSRSAILAVIAAQWVVLTLIGFGLV